MPARRGCKGLPAVWETLEVASRAGSDLGNFTRRLFSLTTILNQLGAAVRRSLAVLGAPESRDRRRIVAPVSAPGLFLSCRISR